jgi:hypothetical protein
MNAQLPEPGSIWKHKKTSRLMRVIISDESQVIVHNCELAMRDDGIPMTSWSDTPATFARGFIPASATNYPRTHN